MRRLVVEIVKASPRRAVLSMVLTLGTSLSEGIGLLLLMPLLELVGAHQLNTLPNVTGWFVWFLGLLGAEATLGSVLALYVVTTLGRTLLARWQSALSTSLREEYTSRMRTRVYDAIRAAEWRYLVTKRQSDLANVLAGEVSHLGTLAFQTTDLIVTALVSSIYVALAIHISARVAALVIGSAAILAWLTRGSLRDARHTGKKASLARRRFGAAVSEHLASMKTARIYGMSDRHAAEFSRLSDDLHDVSLEVAAGEQSLMQNLEAGSVVILASIVYIAIDVFKEPTSSLLVLLFSFARLMPRMTTIYRRLQTIAAGLPAQDAVAHFLDSTTAAAQPVAAPSGVSLRLERAIRFDDVSFAYLSRQDTAAVSGMRLTIPAGRTTAIVGASGSGKSTTVDLLVGLLSPTQGAIYVDDVRLEPTLFVPWRAQVGYVPQETFLFHDTVRANLAWARQDATEDDIWTALEQAAADAFVRGLPDGLDTVVGERGIMISGGERQRLSLARALLRRPSLLVLDEATSALDSETELRVRGAIETLQHSVTIVAITHRLASIAGADLIHVLADGTVVESGTWEDLLAANGRFAALAAAQGIFARPSLAVEPTDPREVTRV